MKRIVSALDKLKWGKRTYVVFLLCAMTAIALPAQTLTTLFKFDGPDGVYPTGPLVQGTDGNLYSTTGAGGTNCIENLYADFSCGTAFKITANGTLTTIYDFCAHTKCAAGFSPGALVQATNWDFYGTTNFGGTGAEACPLPDGCGTIFEITPSGTPTAIYTFCSQSGCTDGYQASGALVPGTDGNFYGTTYSGGNEYCLGGCGTIFMITPAGTLTTLYSFNDTDGAYPAAGLVQGTDEDFYGTTKGGGATFDGTVFKITPSGRLTTLYSFCSQSGCTDGADPVGTLVQATNGDFYGTTMMGGASCTVGVGSFQCGTVFKITAGGTLTTLHRFCLQSGCPDGYQPSAGLIQATDGDLYGTTGGGGANGGGTVFKITPSGTLTTLYSFNGTDGSGPSGLVQYTDGNFYGTTDGGEATRCPQACARL
ncbi:MAG TPA: choice-of-anchor tandem repeat GloVer-containing protein [Bryobacteraceae bacterium]|nr:choice-of-anchor tandem repeat GloVer-containing protein [Bryobacteraceae bacterium]